MKEQSKDLKSKYRRALVTGGAGFIGSHIVERLLNEGLDVVSIDDYSAGKSENLSAFQGNSHFLKEKCDVTDFARLAAIFQTHKFDIIFHEAASKKTVCLKDPRRDLEVNAKGTFNILELSRNFEVKKVIHASTGSVYGEAQYFPQDEKHPLDPTSYYGVSKLAGEKYVIVFSYLYGMNISILRYFHVYGQRQDCGEYGGVVAIFCHRALNDLPLIIFGDGSQERSFTYVKDVVNANILLALKEETNGQVYNCASGINVTIKELADKILNYLGKKHLQIKYEDWTIGDIKHFDVSNKKLTDLGFRFETNFDEGLKKTVEWFKEEK